MNVASILSALLPALLKLLSDPSFQALIKMIEDNLNKKIANGVHPDVATQQATGLLGAAAMLHLTGNPVADFQAFMSNFKPTVFPPQQ